MSVSKKNIEAAKKLVERYRSITAEEIENSDIIKTPLGFNGKCIMKSITGFSSVSGCSLCATVGDCIDCIYTHNTDDMFLCCDNEHAETYDAIADAKNTDELLKALRYRADHIENLLKQIEEEQK